MAASKMTQLIRRLNARGFTGPFIRKVVLPDWWDDEIVNASSGWLQLAGILARKLGLELKSILDESAPIEFKGFDCRFKMMKNKTEADLHLARSLGVAISQMAAAVCRNDYHGVPSSAVEIRKEILSAGFSVVSFEALLNWCWEKGIPVLRLQELPKGVKKMDGMTTMVGGRPVIIIAVKHQQPSRLLFILAHELGHIACQHIGENQTLLDGSLESEMEDDEEQEADKFACQVISGRPEPDFWVDGPIPQARAMARFVRSLSESTRVVAGFIVLNVAHNNRDFDFMWNVAQTTLSLLEPNPRGLEMLDRATLQGLDLHELPEESMLFLSRVAGFQSLLPEEEMITEE